MCFDWLVVCYVSEHFYFNCGQTNYLSLETRVSRLVRTQRKEISVMGCHKQIVDLEMIEWSAV